MQSISQLFKLLLFLISSCAIAQGFNDNTNIAVRTSIPINKLDRFNYIIGTQTFAPCYQFTTQTCLVETAEAIRALGATVIKFALEPNYAGSNHAPNENRSSKGYVPTNNPAIRSLVQLARDEPSYRHVFDMPFINYIIWMHTFSNPGAASWRKGFSKEAQEKEYHEVYDLVVYLLKTYSGTGKTFYLGHWEGDGMLRGRIALANDARVTPAAVQGMITG